MNALNTLGPIEISEIQSKGSAWQIAQDNNDISNPANETLFALSNGFLGMRGGLNEFKSATNNIFIAQIYDNSPIDYHERFPGFARKTDTRIPIADPRKIKIEAQLMGIGLILPHKNLGTITKHLICKLRNIGAKPHGKLAKMKFLFTPIILRHLIFQNLWPLR